MLQNDFLLHMKTKNVYRTITVSWKGCVIKTNIEHIPGLTTVLSPWSHMAPLLFTASPVSQSVCNITCTKLTQGHNIYRTGLHDSCINVRIHALCKTGLWSLTLSLISSRLTNHVGVSTLNCPAQAQ